MILYMCRHCGSVELPEIFHAVDDIFYICPHCGTSSNKFNQQFIPVKVKVDCNNEEMQILFSR